MKDLIDIVEKLNTSQEIKENIKKKINNQVQTTYVTIKDKLKKYNSINKKELTKEQKEDINKDLKSFYLLPGYDNPFRLKYGVKNYNVENKLKKARNQYKESLEYSISIGSKNNKATRGKVIDDLIDVGPNIKK